MKTTIILLAPLVFSVLSLLVWAIFLRKLKSRAFPKFILWCTGIAAAFYIVGFIASLIGDRIHGPADSFDWSPVYYVTLPLMFGGWAASLINLIEATVGAIILHIKEKRISSEQGVAGYGTQGVRRT
jgi:hypothetical protein